MRANQEVGSQAKLSGHNTRGDYGLLSGTQGPVGVHGVGMFDGDSADTLRDRRGDSIPVTSSGGSVNVQAAVAGLLWTSNIKFLGGNYGFAIYPAVTNNAVELPALQTDTETSAGLADLYIQPLILGWTTARPDFMAGLGVYAPTGRYDPDAEDNRGRRKNDSSFPSAIHESFCQYHPYIARDRLGLREPELLNGPLRS